MKALQIIHIQIKYWIFLWLLNLFINKTEMYSVTAFCKEKQMFEGSRHISNSIHKADNICFAVYFIQYTVILFYILKYFKLNYTLNRVYMVCHNLPFWHFQDSQKQKSS